MKLRIALLALIAAAGVLASIAVAKPPPGHGNKHDGTVSTTGTTATGTTTTTSGHGHGKKAPKVLVCHKVGNGHYVLVSVSANSALAKGKHKDDVLATNGTCPGPIQGHQETTTTSTTTTASTTTATTTTSS
ncbi:MAG TPA: hypothetical protein VMU74_00625 [Gaiellaceae bacterium]|nr:hypothetical protein [Gaiellaceae bacterium]